MDAPNWVKCVGARTPKKRWRSGGAAGWGPVQLPMAVPPSLAQPTGKVLEGPWAILAGEGSAYWAAFACCGQQLAAARGCSSNQPTTVLLLPTPCSHCVVPDWLLLFLSLLCPNSPLACAAFAADPTVMGRGIGCCWLLPSSRTSGQLWFWF